MIANYHTHTYRCRHAYGTDREYVEAAIEAGLKILGFSDHVPFLHERAVRMQPEEMEDYVDSILSLREEYKKDIQIYLGLEVEYIPEHFQELYEFLKKYPLDYFILGQHIVLKRWSVDETTDIDMLDAYCEQVVEVIKSGIFSYVAHPDMLNFKGDFGLWEQKMRQICQASRIYQVPLEINFHGQFTGKHYPNTDFWRIAGEEGCPVIYGCDAHELRELTEHQVQLEKASKLVECYHLNLLDKIILRKPF